jgi:hypothetical protein
VEIVEQLDPLGAFRVFEALQQAFCFPVGHDGAGHYAGRRPPAYAESPNT